MIQTQIPNFKVLADFVDLTTILYRFVTFRCTFLSIYVYILKKMRLILYLFSKSFSFSSKFSNVQHLTTLYLLPLFKALKYAFPKSPPHLNHYQNVQSFSLPQTLSANFVTLSIFRSRNWNTDFQKSPCISNPLYEG